MSRQSHENRQTGMSFRQPIFVLAPSAYKTGELLPEPYAFVIYGQHYLRCKNVTDILKIKYISKPVPVKARSTAWVCSRSLADNVGSNPTGGMDVFLLCVLSGRSPCDQLITRPEESY
jgi:hypothetical protein